MTEKTKTWIGIAVLICGALFLGLGIWRGETAVVMQKAIRICLECIGIG